MFIEIAAGTATLTTIFVVVMKVMMNEKFDSWQRILNIVYYIQNKYIMVNLRENILKNQITYYNGLIAKHSQNVEIYLNQPVGIGEHSDVMGAIDGEINAIAQAHEKIQIINRYFLVQ